MRSLILFGYLQLLLASVCHSQDLAIQNIPEELLKNAHAVVRYHNQTITFHNHSRATIHVNKAITVLTRKGRKYGNFMKAYDEFRDLKNIKIVIYDQYGQKVERISKKEIEDKSPYYSYDLYDDIRYKTADIEYPYLPYTVNISYEITHDPLLIEDWPFFSNNLSYQHCNLTVVNGLKNKVKINTYHIDSSRINRNLSDDIITIRLDSIKAFELEPLRTHWTQYLPTVLVQPYHIEMEGTHLYMDSWASLGEWSHSLIDQQAELSAKTKSEIAALTNNLNSELEKIKAIYKYMQDKTRYVSVQLGIGGYKPFPASVVDEVGYGDCKALSNYTMALLKEAGIESLYTIIGAGNKKIELDDFPTLHQNNHVILAVPYEKDTVWLECTSQLVPFGYLGSNTSNRKAIVTSSEGAALVKTPYYGPEKNRKEGRTEISIDDQGAAKTQIDHHYHGAYISKVAGQTFYRNTEERKKHLYKRYDYVDFQIKAFDYQLISEYPAVVKETIDMKIQSFGQVMGERIFFPVVLTKITDGLAENPNENRLSPIEINYGYTLIDTFHITLPQGFEQEFTPDHKTITSEFGIYSLQIDAESNRGITIIRKFTLKDGHYRKEEYKNLVDFFDTIENKESEKIILKRHHYE